MLPRSRTPAAEPTLAAALYEQYVWSARYIDAPVLRDRDAATGQIFGPHVESAGNYLWESAEE
jgi:hypothetical protein